MSGSKHYRDAQRILAQTARFQDELAAASPAGLPADIAAGINAQVALSLARAQVHATLALAAATALPYDKENRPGLTLAWQEAVEEDL